MKRTVYLVLCAIGTVLPFSQLLPFVRTHGLDLRALVDQLFSTHIGAFFGLDVVVSAIVVWVFVAHEGRRLGMRHLWVPVVASLLVGVSLALPLFLYMREGRMDALA